MVANSDHSQTLTPPKRSMRSDNVDFQRGELECGDKNIYFDQYSYNLSAEGSEAVPREVVIGSRSDQDPDAAHRSQERDLHE